MDKEYEVINYNNELFISFFDVVDKLAKNLNDKELGKSVDVIRAINSYRAYPNPNEFLKEYKELLTQEDHLRVLWGHFENLSESELADLAIEMINECQI